MQDTEIMDIFSEIGAYQQGHFKLSSGLHSAAYLQCALVMQDPVVAARLCSVIAEKFHKDTPDIVVGPAMGGIVFAYELARAFNARAVFTERDENGQMQLRRGFTVSGKHKVLIAEDVLTTGRSVKEVLTLLKSKDVTPLGIACLVDRSTVLLDFSGIKHTSLIKLRVPTFTENECMLCREGIPIVKPGSRK